MEESEYQSSITSPINFPIEKDVNTTRDLEKMDPFSNKSHINQKQKEFSTAMQIDSSPEPRTAIDFRASSDEDRSSKYNQSPREEAIDFNKLFDDFEDDKKVESPKQFKKLSSYPEEIIDPKVMASINSKSGIMERKRSSPRNSPRETPKKDSKSKNAVKSAQYNRPERDDYREEDYEYIKKRDPPLEPQPERRKETISELDRIGLDGRFIIPNSELSHKETRERYKKLYFDVIDEDIICCVCMDDTPFVNDEILLCELCNAASHQSCYGSELHDGFPESDWYCHRCLYLLKNDLPPEAIFCEFCPELKGLIKRIRNASDKEWGHIPCVNWIPEIWYEDDKMKEEVHYAEYKASKRNGRNLIPCSICKVPYGDILQCDYKKCDFSFHPTCAQRVGIIFCWEDMAELKRDSDDEHYEPIFCRKHLAKENQTLFDKTIPLADRIKHHDISYIVDPVKSGYKRPEPKQSGEMEIEMTKKIESKESKPKKKKDKDGDKDKGKEKGKGKDRDKEKEKGERGRIRDSSQEKEYNARDKERPLEKPKESAPETLKKEKPEKQSKNEKEEKFNQKSEKPKEKLKKLSEIPSLASDPIPEKPFENFRQQSLEKFIPPQSTKEVQQAKKTALDQTEFIQKMAESEPLKPAKDKKPEPSKQEKAGSSSKTKKKDADPSSPKGEDEIRYQLKPIAARIIGVKGWCTEIEMKKGIQAYCHEKKIYNKEKKILELTECPDLYDLFGVPSIPKKEIFNEFKTFMLKKTIKEITGETDHLDKMLEQKRAQFELQKKKEAEEAALKKKKEAEEAALKKKKEEEKRKSTLAAKTTKPSEPIKPQVRSPILTEPYNPESPRSEPDDYDFFGSNTKIPKQVSKELQRDPIKEPQKESQKVSKLDTSKSAKDKSKPNIESPSNIKKKKIKLNDKTDATDFLQGMLGGGGGSPRKKSPEKKLEGLARIVGNEDWIPFRKQMNWFNKVDKSIDIDYLNSKDHVAKLWPKGAELLF